MNEIEARKQAGEKPFDWKTKFDEEWNDILDKSQDDELDRMQIKSFITFLLTEIISEIPDNPFVERYRIDQDGKMDNPIKQQLKEKYL